MPPDLPISRDLIGNIGGPETFNEPEVQCAVARVLAMEFWTRGVAPTFEEFAAAWTKAKVEQHRLLTPEYAYLTDLRHHRANADWRELRSAKAKSALATLGKIAPASPQAPSRRS